MRILQLTPRLPYPPIDGGRVVMLQIALALQRNGCGVDVLSLNPRKQRGDPALAPIAIEAIDIDTSQYARAFLQGLRIGAPTLVARFYSKRFEAALRAKLRTNQYDVVQVESPFLLPYVRAIRDSSKAIVVLRSLNVEFRIWEQRGARTIARSLRRYEARTINLCDAIVPITEDDAREFRALGCARPMHVLPAGVDVQPVSDAGEGVGFLASLDYKPNQDAALWIAEKLGDDIQIAGSNAPPWLAARLGAKFFGEVPDAAAFIRSKRVIVAPVFAGGGMRVKILEAMSHGKRVVATTLAAAGIDVTDGENIVIANDAPSFAKAIEALRNDPRRGRSIGDAARALVAQRYDTDTLARGLIAFYEGLQRRS